MVKPRITATNSRDNLTMPSEIHGSSSLNYHIFILGNPALNNECKVCVAATVRCLITFLIKHINEGRLNKSCKSTAKCLINMCCID